MRRSYSSGSRGNMRNGLLSLLTVVVTLCLATAAVLTVSTARAMDALAQRQANMAQEGYDAERAGQTTLAMVDDVLHKAVASGVTDAKSLAARVESQANGILVEACPKDTTATYEVTNTTLTCTFTTKGGRVLNMVVQIGDGGTYEVVSWKLTAAPQSEDTGETLWTGPTATD